MSRSSASSDDEDEYGYVLPMQGQRRYPVHDCCEFEDAEALRKLIFVPEDDDSDGDERRGKRGVDESSSSSDDNDSAAAAHAAAIGHSPQPIPTKLTTSQSPGDETGPDENGEASEPAADALAPQKEEGKAEEETLEDTAMDVTPSSPTQKDVEEAVKQEEEAAVPAEVDADGTPQSSKKRTAEAKKEKSRAKKIKYYCPHNINERDGDENTPLHIAIHSRKLEHVKLLLEAGASVLKKCDGSAPIHTAISMGALVQHGQFAYRCVELLHQYGADISMKDDAVHTPLYLACFYNLPQVAQFLLSKEEGLSTLNARSDRSGGRALHAAAKFDTLSNGKLGRVAASAAPATGAAKIPIHHPDGTVANTTYHAPGVSSKVLQVETPVPLPGAAAIVPPRALVTEVLLETGGIEVEAPDAIGQTALHLACARGNWTVARLLLQAGSNPATADKRGYTPGQVAYKRGMPIPNDLIETLGGPPETGTVPPPRDLVVDPHSSTLITSHELCTQHRSCPPMIRDAANEPPPENIRRLTVLVDDETGILKTGEFGGCAWNGEARRAAMVDILKCHEFNYVERISQLCSSIPDHPNAIGHLDGDTAISRWSFEAALRAAGSVCQAVDKVVAGDFRNAFCAVRPPGHHAGPRGIVRCENDADGGSHGFCLLNNVAIGAAYARSMYRNDGIRKIAIVDFDVHHGNGTEEIIRQLVPTVEKAAVRMPFAIGEFATPKYRPWLDETDVNDVFFASTHGYGPRGVEFTDTPAAGWFYPASGKSHTSDSISNPSVVETPNMADFILSQAWTRIGDDAKSNCCKIMNCGLGLPKADAVPGMQRLELRDTYRQKILPRLREFDPDIIFISAGFDAHKKDTMNFGYVGMVEDDYEWVTDQLVRIANTCCNGRIVSVLEGGYKIHGGIVSPFARSVASHVRALNDGGRSRELYDPQNGQWEGQFERHIVEERERKRQQKIEKLRQVAEHQRQALFSSASGGGANGGEGGDENQSTRKRKRVPVDYRELYEQMKREGFAA